MATNFRNFKNGINLEPLSADPSSPSEGDLFISDGTPRAAGLWEYRSGAWVQFAAADPAVVAIYNTNAGQSIPNATETIINFEDLEKDTDSAVTTGASWKFTAPETADYDVSTVVTLGTIASFNSGETFQIYIQKNGTTTAMANFHTFSYTGAGDAFSLVLSGTVSLVAGDFIDIRTSQSSGGAVSLFASGPYNRICIRKV